MVLKYVPALPLTFTIIFTNKDHLKSVGHHFEQIFTLLIHPFLLGRQIFFFYIFFLFLFRVIFIYLYFFFFIKKNKELFFNIVLII